jgi:neutral ceramidase
VIGLPFETTVEAGRRIAATTLEAGLGVDTAFVSSLVNDQTDYLTTREEYAAQYYEGASVLFGPQQQAWVAGQARKLANDLIAGIGSVPRARTFDFGVRRYLARPTGDRVTRLPGAVRYVETTPDEDGYWEQVWSDVSPGDLVWHEPLVRVEAELAEGWSPASYDGRLVDDQGWHLGVSYLGRQHGQHTYAARWFAPPLGRPGRHRFVLLANAMQPEIAGPAFD